MTAEILKDLKNELLGRKEVKIIVPAKDSLNFPEAKKILSEEFKVDEDKIAVLGIKGKFGRNTFLIEANIYSSREEKEKTEPKPKPKKGAEAESGAGGAGAEGAQAEKPAEAAAKEKK